MAREMPTQTVSPLLTAIKTFGNVQELFSNQYRNKGLQLLNAINSNNLNISNQTMDDLIRATNIKNQTDQKYIPLDAEAELRKKQADITEIQARTGASRAQANEIMSLLPYRISQIKAQNQKYQNDLDPIYNTRKMIEAYKNAPEGSEEKNILMGLIDKEIGNTGLMALGFLPGNGRASFGGVSSGVSRGAPRQTISYDQEGRPLIRELPTTAAATQAQNRLAAHAELEKLQKVYNDSLNVYGKNYGSFKLLGDIIGSRFNENISTNRLKNYATGINFLPEIASIAARQATGGVPGEATIRDYQNMFSKAAPLEFLNKLLPGNVKDYALNQFLPIQNKAIGSAVEQERLGFPTYYGDTSIAQPQQQRQKNFLSKNTDIPAPAQSSNNRNLTKPNLGRLSSPNSFNSTEEAREYFSNLSPYQQKLFLYEFFGVNTK